MQSDPRTTGPVPLAEEDREANNTPAYLIGRLVSILEDLEWSAAGEHTMWYKIFPAAIANPHSVLRQAGTESPRWLRKLEPHNPESAEYYRGAIASLIDRIGEPGMLAGAQNGQWVTLGYYHQQHAAVRAGIHPLPHE